MGLRNCKTVILATGVYLNSDIISGDVKKFSGPNGFQNATKLTENLIRLGFNVRRFKTGTPARLHADTLDYSKMELEKGDDRIVPFSFENEP